MKKMDKKKGQGIHPGLTIKNYFALAAVFVLVSAVKWIANFGVVPLFLLAAFLLAPAFFAFLALLFSVTHVLETIGPLLYNRYNRAGINTNIIITFLNQNFKPYFVPSFNLCVKGIFGFLILVSALELALPNLYAQDLILSKGQSQSINLPTLEKFNVANKEVITYKFDEKSKTLIIRGAKLGTSEVLIWNKGDDTPTRRQIFVISKIQEAKYLHIAQLLAGLDLSTKIHLPHLVVSGEMQGLKQYLQYKNVQAQHEEIILDETTLSADLKKEILADIYQLFFNDYKDSIKCHILHSEVTCLYPNNEAPSEGMKKHLMQKYRVNFLEHSNQQLKRNYSFKLKLIQLEQMDGEELRLGLEQLSATLGELLIMPLTKIVEKNSVLLAQKKVQMNTLAEPSGLLRPQTPAEFQIGADVPFTTQSKDGISNTLWQFAGLKIKVTIENMGEKIKINYETELTKPSLETNGPIGGNKEKSSIVIPLNQPTQLFQVSLKTDALATDQMPFVGRIPLIGELFKSKSSQNNYKMITGIIEVKEHE